MHNMTPLEYRRFLLDSPRTGMLATVRANGSPHAVPIWFDLDGDTLIFTTWHTSVKTRNLQRDPRASLCVDDQQLPYAFVLVDGVVEFLSVTPEERLYWATRIARRYVGDAQAEAFGKRNGVEGELVARLTPTKIVARRGITD